MLDWLLSARALLSVTGVTGLDANPLIELSDGLRGGDEESSSAKHLLRLARSRSQSSRKGGSPSVTGQGSPAKMSAAQGRWNRVRRAYLPSELWKEVVMIIQGSHSAPSPPLNPVPSAH